MKKVNISLYCVVILVTGIITGCGPETPEDIQRRKLRTEASAEMISKNLPEGCEIGYAGVFDAPSRDIPIVYVDCKGATTVNMGYSIGKTSQYNAVVKIKELEQVIEKADQELQMLKMILEKLSPEERRLLGIQEH